MVADYTRRAEEARQRLAEFHAGAQRAVHTADRVLGAMSARRADTDASRLDLCGIQPAHTAEEWAASRAGCSPSAIPLLARASSPSHAAIRLMWARLVRANLAFHHRNGPTA